MQWGDLIISKILITPPPTYSGGKSNFLHSIVLPLDKMDWGTLIKILKIKKQLCSLYPPTIYYRGKNTV